MLSRLGAAEYETHLQAVAYCQTLAASQVDQLGQQIMAANARQLALTLVLVASLGIGAVAMFRSMGQSAADPKAQREFIDKARPSSIIKRLEQPEEIAEVVAFLVSREAAAISGSPVRADGGVVLAIT